MPKIKDVTARGGLGGKSKEASARATFENEDVRITPSVSSRSSTSNKKYNDDVSVDTSSKQSSVNLDGEMRVNKDVDVRAGLGRSKYSLDEKASRGGKDIGGYEEDSSSTRKSLGGRYKDLNVDYLEDKPSRGDTYKKLEGSYNIKNDENEQLRVSGSTDSQKKSKVGIDYTLRFADGGVVPETERMLADGGIMQEGGTVDEASGNEVPAGSLKEEVRDDVDAKLSVGEFVVPADVVRYIGLENLMKMRDKAKAGLKQMSDIGQMGNAEEVDEEDVGEFSSAVDDVMGEEEDDTAFSSAVDETMNEEKGVRKMAVGGYVQPENAATYANAPLKGFEMVSLVNDAGNVIYIPYVNGKPQLSIPSGYKVKTGAVDTTATAVAPAGAGAATGGVSQTMTEGGGGGVSSGGPSSTNASASLDGMVSGVTPSDVSTLGRALSIMGMPALGMVASLGKGMISDATTATAAAQNQATVAAQLGLTAEEAASPVGQAAIASAIDSSPNMGENVGNTATTGTAGTGSAATAAGANAAAAAAANGMSDAAQGAAAQAAASATIGGANAADAATAGGAAAAATQGIADSVAANNAAIGDVSGGTATGPGVGTGSGIGGGDTGGVSPGTGADSSTA